jgi:trk system potassium uptake protein
MQFRAIIQVLGGMLMVFSLTFLLPIIWSVVVTDGALLSFVCSAFGTAFVGLCMWLPNRRHKQELQPRDGCLLVVLGWLLMAAAATIPLMLQIKDLSFTDAYFETMSGLTTTGATVLTGLEKLPQSVNIWRHALNWYGGMGIIVLAVAILPLLGVGGMQLYKAETPGPMKEGKLTPRITQTAKYLWLVYAGITALCCLSLMFAGMDFFEALCHSFSAMALGGFSTRDGSVGDFNSLAIELVLVFFMMVAVLNFATHFLAISKRSFKPYKIDPEAVPVLVVILGSCVMLGFVLWTKGTYSDFWTALRHATFNTVSIATSSGFMSQDFDKWPIFTSMWMYLLCATCASAGSTGGGIKMIRTLILCRQALRELLRMVHPRVVNPMILNGSVIDNKVVLAVMGYMLLYGATLVALTMALLLTDLDFVTSFTAIIACLNNAGPGLNLVGPASNYQVLTDVQTWVCTIAMFLGRVELLTVFVIFTPHFWRR